MSLAHELSSATGTYDGTGDGAESGPFVARIAVARLPNGDVSIDYVATSREEGVPHREHSLLVVGPDGRDQLYIAHSESPFVTVMTATDTDPGRFTQLQPSGPFVMEVVIGVPEPGQLTYAWWCAEAGSTPVEQSRADTRLTVT